VERATGDGVAKVRVPFIRYMLRIAWSPFTVEGGEAVEEPGEKALRCRQSGREIR